MTKREKGVANMACPNCGKELAYSDQPDGSIAAETCSKCHPASESKTEKASASSAPRERGTKVTNKEENDG